MVLIMEKIKITNMIKFYSIVLLNQDTKTEPDWLSRLVEKVEK